jgi:predicted acetyltransferase
VFATAPDQALHRYLVRRGGEVTGYMIYTHEPEASSVPYTFVLACRDLVWHDAESLAALLNLAAGHQVVGRGLTWPGPVEEPLAGFIGFEPVEVRQCVHWMSRIVDLGRALEFRGYPRPLEVELDLAVSDPWLPENELPVHVSVSDGQARVTPARGVPILVDVGALAAMYTGWWPARAAARAGRLHGATARQLEDLELLFSGPKPWMFDRF